MLEEKTNLVEVIGVLSEVDIKEGTKDGKDYLAGTIKVKSKIEINKQKVDVEIPFNVYANKLTKNNTTNPAWESIKAIRDDGVSIAACGNEEEATYVRVYSSNGSIRENAFYNQAGQLVSTSRIGVSFFNVVQRNKYEDEARFETVIFLLKKIDEVDKEGNPTGRLIVKGAVPGYGGVVNVIDYVVTNIQAIEHINSFWNEGDTVKVYGKINFTTIVTTTMEETGFGEPVSKKQTTSKRELVITSGSAGALDPEESFSQEDITVGLEERLKRINATKEKAAPAPVKKVQDFGF